jgi:hypothetical protein
MEKWDGLAYRAHFTSESRHEAGTNKWIWGFMQEAEKDGTKKTTEKKMDLHTVQDGA